MNDDPPVNNNSVPCPVCGARPGARHIPQDGDPVVDTTIPPNRPYPSTTGNRPENEL